METELSQSPRYWAWFLVALLVLPGVGAIPIVWRCIRLRPAAGTHLRWAFYACCGVAVTLLLVPGVMWFSLPDSALSWMWIILWVVTTHGGWVLLGVYGLSRAMNQRPFLKVD